MTNKIGDCEHGVPVGLICGACENPGEFDPGGTDPHTPGAKLDGGKPPLLRGLVCYFPRALDAVASVSEFGANKYTWGGWRTVPDGEARYSDAMLRHLTKEQVEGSIDSETGLPHAAHAAWNALARLELALAAQAMET